MKNLPSVARLVGATSVVIGLCVHFSRAAAGQTPSLPGASPQTDALALAAMEGRANKILSGQDNILIRNEIDPVFEFADRCVLAGQTNKALSFYTRALEHKPWNLSAQLAAARLLKGAGNIQEGNEKAELVWKYAETDGLLAGAAEALGKTYDSKLTTEPLPGSRGVALAPIGDVDAWLIREVRDGLKEILGIPVVIQPVALPMFPQPDRDPLKVRAADLRQRLEQLQIQPATRENMKALALDRNAWQTEEGTLASAEKLLTVEKDPTPLKNFRDEVRALRALGAQWDADKLLNDLQISARRVQRADPNANADAKDVVVLAITRLDLFSNQSRYVFGISRVGENRAIMSYRRYTGAAFDTTPNRQKLKERTLKQAVSSIGMALGQPRCADPTCARAYANSLDEHDAKEVKLCRVCRGKMDARFPK